MRLSSPNEVHSTVCTVVSESATMTYQRDRAQNTEAQSTELTGTSTRLGNGLSVDDPDGGRFSRGMNDQVAAVAGDEGSALRPVRSHFGQPLHDQVAKAAVR